MTSLRTRLVGALALGTLAASLSIAPAAAGGGSVWVDDDGTAGPNGCGGGATAPETINAGIAAASAGGTIRVCPGVYREFVDVDKPGLTVVSVQPWGAVVRAPAVTARRPAGDATLVRVLDDDVTIQWLKLSLPSGPPCLTNNHGVQVYQADDVQIRSNRIIGGRNENSLHCGMASGISLSQSSGLVAYNTIRNYNQQGIAVYDSSGPVRILENSIHWEHTGTFCGSTACTRSSRVSRVIPAGGPDSPGIRIQDSTTRVARNHLEVDADSPDTAQGGITVYGSNVRIRDNTVIRFDYGITAGYGSSGTIADNRVRRGRSTGIDIHDNVPVSTGQFDPIFRVLDNRVRGFEGNGIGLFSAPGNLIQGNDFTQNPGTDCYDSADPTESVWIDNKGNDQNQAGLCEPV